MSDPDKWYRSTVPELQAGAASGDPDAMYHLAQRYRRGKEVPQDIPQAVEWLLRAADLGHAHAQSSMGVRYYYGEGVPKNHRLAMKWYLAGAADKEPEALYNVGDLFDDSDEIPKNPVECCAWMLVAAAYGYRTALDRVDPLVKNLSAENLDLAARRGAQIYARCEAGEPLDPSASFREARPFPPPVVTEVGDEPTRLSLLVEFAYRCEQEAIDHLLMYELIHG
ncbi:MAG: tetratricopeptide repeat protein, partial [Opitutales bacterium]